MGQLGDLSPQGSVALGVVVGLASTGVQSLGLTLQRKSHILEDEKEPQIPRRPPHRRRRWQLGMFMFIVSNLLGSTIQITTLPLPVLSTLQASGLVFNSICATLILGELFTRWSLVGTVLVSAGAVLIALFGALEEPAHNLDGLLLLLGRHQFLLWMICQAILVGIIITGVRTTIFFRPRSRNTPRGRLLRGLAYGSVSGILSAHSLLVAKSAVELLVRTVVDRSNQFNRWQSWIILLGLVALALTQLYYLHSGLKLCSTSVLYPFVFCVYNIVAILDGLIYFRQTSRLSVLHGIFIALGTIILLMGVLALSWRLDDVAAVPPQAQVAGSALGPGLGYLDSQEPEDGQTGSPLLVDEETAPESQAKYGTLALRSGPDSPRTPMRRGLSILSAKRNSQVDRIEAGEIWDELEDEIPTASSPLLSRRVSMPDPLLLGRRSVEEPATERTSLLRNNGSQGRPDRDWRRKSTPLFRRPASSPSHSISSVEEHSQKPVGEWWKLKWWRRRQSGERGDGSGV